MDIWQETFPVGFAAVDRSDCVTLAGIFDFFQEAAIRHAEDRGVGRDAMNQSGQAWVLSRISGVVNRRPRQGEIITVRTWPRGWERLFAVRDYDIRDESGVPLVRGRSFWLILDINKRRPLRPQALMTTLPSNEGMDVLSGGAVELKPREDLRKAGERRAAYSDIDYNGHVNNARYVQWIQDIMENEDLEQPRRMRLDINYLSEVKPGDITGLWMAPIPGDEAEAGGETGASGDGLDLKAFALEGRRQDEGQAVFRAELRTGT
jgi:acyl-ACP thioesterase